MIAPFWFYETITQGSDLFKTEVFWVAISALGTVAAFTLGTLSFRQSLKDKKSILNLEVSPFVSLAYSIDYDLGEVYLELKNYGKSPAYNIVINANTKLSSPFWINVIGATTKDIGDISWFKEPIKYLAPNQSIKVLYSNRDYLKKEHRNDHKGSEGTIEYYDRSKSDILKSDFYLDPTILWTISARGNRENPLNKHLKNIHNELNQLNQKIAKPPIGIDLSPEENERHNISLGRDSKTVNTNNVQKH